MQLVENQSKIQNALPKNWEKKKEAYSDDALIDAFLRGKEAGKNEALRILMKQFRTNVQTATVVAEKLYKEVNQLKFTPKTIHIKADGISTFSALFVVERKHFLLDSFRNVYVKARKLKNEVVNDDFYISFSFMPYSNKLSENCLAADGYFMKYEKR